MSFCMESSCETDAAWPISPLAEDVQYYPAALVVKPKGGLTVHELWHIYPIILLFCEAIGHQSDVHEFPAKYVRYENYTN